MTKVFKFFWIQFKKLDKIVVLIALGLIAFSTLLLYSIYKNEISGSVYSSTYKTQMIAGFLGICLAFILTYIDYRKIAKLWWLYGVGAFLLTLLTFTPLGIGREGTTADDKAWINLGVTTVQPSEILKIAFILSISYHVYKIGDKINQPINLFFLFVHFGAVAGIVSLQGDQGTALVFAMIFICVLFVGKVSMKYFITAIVASPILAILAWQFFLQGHHKDRILILFNPELDPLGIGLQQIQGKIALGSGQMFGKGLFGGNYSYVSEVHNDFIFSYIGQALGFVGCAMVLAIYAILLIKIAINGIMAKDTLGQLVCTGVFGMILMHLIMNVGMVIGVMPVIGVPLPLLSAGGTNVLSTFLALGLVLSVYAHSEKNNSLFY